MIRSLWIALLFLASVGISWAGPEISAGTFRAYDAGTSTTLKGLDLQEDADFQANVRISDLSAGIVGVTTGGNLYSATAAALGVADTLASVATNSTTEAHQTFALEATVDALFKDSAGNVIQTWTNDPRVGFFTQDPDGKVHIYGNTSGAFGQLIIEAASAATDGKITLIGTEADSDPLTVDLISTNTDRSFQIKMASSIFEVDYVSGLRYVDSAGADRWTVDADAINWLAEDATAVGTKNNFAGIRAKDVGGNAHLFAVDEDGTEVDLHALGSAYQASDATLSAVAALDSTAGYLVITGADTFVRRTFGDTGTIAWTNPAGTAGNSSAAVVADSIGDTQLAFNTGQTLTTTSDPTFDDPTFDDFIADTGTFGTSSLTPVIGFNVSPQILLQPATGQAHLMLSAFSDGETLDIPLISSRLARGTAAAPTIVLSGDNPLMYEAVAYDGDSFHQIGHFGIIVEGTPADGDVRGSYRVATYDGTSLTNRFEIDDSGIVMVASAPSEGDFAQLDGSGDFGVEDELQVLGAGFVGGLFRVDNGTLGTNGTATAAGDAYVEDALEVDGQIISPSITASTTMNLPAGGAGAPQVIFAGSSTTGYWMEPGSPSLWATVDEVDVWNVTTEGTAVTGTASATGSVSTSGTSANFGASAAGGGLAITEGANGTMGLSTLTSGTVTVSTTKIQTGERVMLCHQTAGGTLGFLTLGTITNNTSFVITSVTSAGVTQTLDTSTVLWIIVDPIF